MRKLLLFLSLVLNFTLAVIPSTYAENKNLYSSELFFEVNDIASNQNFSIYKMRNKYTMIVGYCINKSNLIFNNIESTVIHISKLIPQERHGDARIIDNENNNVGSLAQLNELATLEEKLQFLNSQRAN
jgi:hypothetical protein